MSAPVASPPDAGTDAYVRRHLLFGWWSLLGFLLMGIGLEAMHGFKVGWYLGDAYETRRLLWTLAHAHGALLALVNVAFAFTLRAVPDGNARFRRLASPSLLAASVLMPAGFFLGGVVFYAGDPGLGIAPLPVGAALLAAAVSLTAWEATTALRARR